MSILSKIDNFLSDFSKFPEIYLKQNNINFIERKSKITLNDTIMYRFRYIFEDESNTFKSITSYINSTNALSNSKHKFFTKTAIYKKEKKIPVDLYKNIFLETKKFYDELYNSSNSIILIDGVYSNTNLNQNGKVETAMNLGFYDSINCVPVDIHFTGEGKKNNEGISLKDYISKNLDIFKGKLIICDRAYFCYNFFNYLVDNGINFIIRLRDNADETVPNKNAKHYKDYIKIKNNDQIRIITRKYQTEKKSVDDNNSINTIEKETIVKLITNLDKNNYNDEKILDLYKSRWDIEEFYKQLKHNFKFQNMKEHKKDCYNKNIYTSLTIMIIKQLIIKYYEISEKFENNKIKPKKNDNTIMIKYKINENLIYSGIKDKLLDYLINGKINNNIMKIILKSYIDIQCCQEGRHYERKSKRPFTKWYVKKYHDIYKIRKKCLEEEIKFYLKHNDNEAVKELKKKRKELNKEYKELKNEIKKNINSKDDKNKEINKKE